MIIEISKSDLKHILRALYLAIKWEDSLIHLYQIQLVRDMKYHIPKEWKKDVNLMKRNISNFKLIRNKFRRFL